MIYRNVLNELDNDSLPRRKPMFALTCKLVNREIMSLLFQKYGRFVGF